MPSRAAGFSYWVWSAGSRQGLSQSRFGCCRRSLPTRRPALGWLWGLPGQLLARWRTSALLPRLALLFLLAIFGLALLQTLTPPWDYDSLMYHLVGPRSFLEANGSIPFPIFGT